jgi:hypothetical protein
MKLIIYLYLVSRSRIVELYLQYPIRIHDLVLNELSTGATLLLPLAEEIGIPTKLKLKSRVFFS